MIKVAILGSTGMLGSALAYYLENESVDIYEFNRSGTSITKKNYAKKFDVKTDANLFRNLEKLKCDYIINCIGFIRQLIDENDKRSVKLAYEVNTNFPSRLNEYASKFQTPIIQIGTDCVYSGQKGNYSENDPHDPHDIYGVTKSKGEVASTASMILRCSIIGKEVTSANSLLSWVLSNPINSEIKGFTNHYWNGLTTLHFSQIVFGIIKSQSFRPGVFHLIPNEVVSKHELITLITQGFDRTDIKIDEFATDIAVNRSLTTNNAQQNLTLWNNAGYNQIPTIEEMIFSYARWSKQ
jgi:dTDP-4-dehydrorhamnose reductase